MSDQTDVLQGTLDLLIMRTIAPEPMHGWAIAQRIQQIVACLAASAIPVSRAARLDPTQALRQE